MNCSPTHRFSTFHGTQRHSTDCSLYRSSCRSG
jgi:hypothetical protein